MKKAVALVLMACIGLSCAGIMKNESKNVYFVAPNGDDANPGTKSQPFATVSKAQSTVRSLIKKGIPKGGVTVYLRGGGYFLDETLLFKPEDSGEKGSMIRYTAYKDEVPVISGGREITGWKKLDHEVPGIRPAAKGKLWFAKVPKGWLFHYLNVDGNSAVRATTDTRFWRKWPKDWYPASNKDAGTQLIRLGARCRHWLEGLPSNGDVELQLIANQYGCGSLGGLTEINTETMTARWNGRCTWLGKPRHQNETGFRLCNHVSFIEAPNSWAVDSDAGIVYYYKPDNMDLSKVSVIGHKLTELIRLEGVEEKGPWVHHIEISGITFAHSDRTPELKWEPDRIARFWCDTGSTITMTGAHDNTFKNNKVMFAGAYAIGLTWYAQNNTIEANEIAAPGCGGIRLQGYGPGLHDVNTGNVVTRNYIHHTGQAGYLHSPAIDVYQSSSNTISYNLTYRLPYSGIMISGMMPSTFSDTSVMTKGKYFGGLHRWAFWFPRLEDFSEKDLELIRAGKRKFSRDETKKYLHTRHNKIYRNVVIEPHLLLNEGGAIYAKSPGSYNEWRENLIYKSTAMPSSTILSLDNVVEYQILKDNVVWIKGRALGTIAHRKDERGNDISGNYRVNYFPAKGDSERLRPNRAEYVTFTESRDPFYNLQKKIEKAVSENGGWPEGGFVDVPGPGEPVVPLGGQAASVPKDSHVTIEE